MTNNPALIDIVCCPVCGDEGTLRETAGSPEMNGVFFQCSRCETLYPVLGGIPLLWSSDAECVRSWNHRYKDLVLSDSTLKGWTGVEPDPAGEGAVWNRMQSLGKQQCALAGPPVFLAALVVLAVALIFRLYWLIIPAALGLLWVLGFAWTMWSLTTKHRYLCRRNYFVGRTRLIAELVGQDDLSERKHFGGGEAAFRRSVSAESLAPPEGTEREREQHAFVSRKAAYVMRRLRRIVSPDEMRTWHVLCLGCGGPSHQDINRVFADAGCTLVGVDTQDFNTVSFHHLFQSNAILANAMRLPLKKNLFDCVVFTDVLEHLHDPLAGLKEIHRVLKPGGVLVLTTNNLAHHRHVANPVAFGKIWLGQWFPKLLPCRDTTSDWDGKVFYHGEFARRELLELFALAGFPKPAITTSNISTSSDGGNRKADWLRRFGMGEEFFVLGKKKS